ncbi:hypothetical protein B0H14DRAFT_2971719, partial [Mycena olivaceomarginata]
MPISFSVAPHTANSIELTHSFSAMEILATSCKDQHRYVEEMLQFAVSCGSNRWRARTYLSHTMSLPCLFIALSELLRANFVAHEGQRELVIWAEGNRYSLDFGSMSRQMVDLIEKNIVDPTLHQWVLSNFTTTTVNDTTVAAVLMMATLKQYFSYGEKSDWVDILGRLEKLKEYGMETIAWYHLLCPVISRFVAAFNAPASQDNVEFWQKVAHLHHPSSGRSYYSGWINAFNPFDKEGRWIGNALDKTVVSEEAPELMTAGDLIFDGTPYHCVGADSVPPAYAEVDIDCFMLAGMVGGAGENDTVHPVPRWWICTKKQNVVSAQEEEEAHLEEIMRDFEERRKKR